MILNFVKMSGSGNDFILLDNRKKIIPEKNYMLLAQKLCQQKLGIGADGIIFLEKGEKLPFRMRYFNRDGSEAAMCGNGSRCFSVFVYFCGYRKKSFQFETKAGPILTNLRKIPKELLSAKEAVVTVQLPLPHSLKLDFPLNLDGKKLNACFLNTGVPHTVIFVNNLLELDVYTLGKKIRNLAEFAPEGTNVNFVQVIKKHYLSIRTYERGVENETLACGTGATASAIIAGIKNLVTSPVKVKTRGGEILEIAWRTDKNRYNIKDVFLTGKVQITFTGKVYVQEVKKL